MDTIETARRRRGTVLAKLTRIEWDIAALEGNEEITPSDLQKVNRLTNQVKDINRDYEQRHVEVLNLIESGDQDTLDLEEEVFDKHVNRVADILERLWKLEEMEVLVAPAVAEPSHGLVKRLRYSNQEKETIIEDIWSLPSGP